MLRLPGGVSVSRTVLLCLTLLAAVLLALGLRSHFGDSHPSEDVQMRFANGINTALAADEGSTAGDQPASNGGEAGAANSQAGAAGASAILSDTASTEYPADFSADLSLDPSSSFLAPISRGSGSGSASITTLAISRLGDACFQPKAAPGEYLDCSALVQWCYSRLGIGVPRTAAGQAEYCQQNKLIVSRSQLQCGDLIFWSFEKNGRFKDISHTGIYAGNGKIIDASYSRGQVVYRDLYSPEQIVMCGRIPAGR